MFLTHGGRPTKGNGRKRKGVDEYAAENSMDFTSRSIIRDGQILRTLVCRFCCQSIGARSDRIKEHIASKRHQKMKIEAFKIAAETGLDFPHEYASTDDNDSLGEWAPEAPIFSMQTGSAEANSLEADGNNQTSNIEVKPKIENTNFPDLPQINTGQINSEGSPGGLSVGWESSVSPSASETPPAPKGSVPAPQLCVQRVNYESNIVKMISKMRNLSHFVDVTLWCEGRTIKCHKIILSACSTYFENLFTIEVPNLHPIIFLKDMTFWEVQSLVEFMYKGEVNIPQGKLQSFLLAAKSLQIRGLASASNDMGEGENCDGSVTTEDNEQPSY